MIDFAQTLNPAQYEAACTLGGSVLVIAGAGSGKTRTIVYRLAHLAEQGVPTQSMLLLTFTRKAAQEMLHRAAQLLGYALGGVQGGTFHGFAFSVLRQYRPEWVHQQASIMDSSDSVSAIQYCKEGLGFAKGDRSFPKNQTILSYISKARNKELAIEEVLQREAFHLLSYAADISRIADAYTVYRREHDLFDYDDLLFELEALLRTRPEVLAMLRERYRYIMVDEYQDTNRVQARIVRLLALGTEECADGQAGNIMAVGDEAQSIYAFRGATVRNILDFPILFPQTKIIKLEENYRSTPGILNVANAVLAHASESFGKQLFTQRAEGATVRLVYPLSDLSQARLVAARIEELLEDYRAGEIAVLFRAGFHSYHLEMELNRRAIRFRKYGGQRYTEASHIKDILAYVRLLLNPLDLPSFERVAALCPGIGPKTTQKIYQALLQTDLATQQKMFTKYPELAKDIKLLENIRSQHSTPQLLVSTLLEHYRPRLESQYPDDWPRRLQGLEELLAIATGYTELDLFIADLALESPDEKEEQSEAITLSTIHSSKGLEWDAVIIMDLVEERFPSRHATVRADDFEEERRLMYVACTRAKNQLDLFVPASLYSKSDGFNSPAVPSPFVRELPFGLCEEWQEGYTGTLVRKESARVNVTPPERPRTQQLRTTQQLHATQQPRATQQLHAAENQEHATPGANKSTKLGYCTHKIFGRGKIVEELPPDKYRVNFQGLGLKVILSAYLTLEG